MNRSARTSEGSPPSSSSRSSSTNYTNALSQFAEETAERASRSSSTPNYTNALSQFAEETAERTSKTGSDLSAFSSRASTVDALNKGFAAMELKNDTESLQHQHPECRVSNHKELIQSLSKTIGAAKTFSSSTEEPGSERTSQRKGSASIRRSRNKPKRESNRGPKKHRDSKRKSESAADETEESQKRHSKPESKTKMVEEPKETQAKEKLETEELQPSLKTGEANFSVTISKDSIIARLGGEPVVKGSIFRFFKRATADPELAPFFKNVSMNRLREHQYRFMAVALGGGPVDGQALQRKMLMSHKRLFAMGLNETHFDRVFDHFVAVLQEKQVDPQALQDFGAALAGFRPLFVEKERLAAQDEKASSQPPVSLKSAVQW